MNCRRAVVLAMLVLGLCFSSPTVKADDSRPSQSVTVSFGAGLNTANGPNVANHHIVPRVIRVRTSETQPAVVNFVVAGLHQIIVYSPGVEPADIVVPATGLFINDFKTANPASDKTEYYAGVNPGPPGGPNPALPVNPARANLQNRVESVSFTQPGTYLVICNVKPHFQTGMMAHIKVVGDDN